MPEASFHTEILRPLRLSHGVYMDSGTPGNQFDDLRAAWLSTEPKIVGETRIKDRANGVVVAGPSAARLHGIGDLWADRYEFVTPQRRQSQRAEIRYRQRSLDAQDVTLVEGLPDCHRRLHLAARQRRRSRGLRYPPLVPIWGREAIPLQPIRTGFPCFAAALAGYVEATLEDDAEKNSLCPPSPLSNTPADWPRMQVLGARASSSFTSHPDIRAWANTVSLNPARIRPELAESLAVTAALERLSQYAQSGMARMAQFTGLVSS